MPLTALLYRLRTIIQAESGAVALLFGLLAIPVIGMVGLSIDTVRAYQTRHVLTRALDAAALAGGKNMRASDRDTIINDYFRANWNASNKLGAVPSAVTIVADASTGYLKLSATADLPTIFSGVLGIDTVTLGSESEIERTDTVLELALAIDTTGSMRCSADASLGCSGGRTRMQAVIQASNDLLAELYGSNTTDSSIFVSMVPFVSAVNVGKAHSSWVDPTQMASVTWNTGPYASSEGWRGCVVEDTAHYASEEPPGPSTFLFRPYYARASTVNYNAGDAMGYPGYALPVFIKGESPIYGSGMNSGCGMPIIPMTNSRTAIANAVNVMKPSLQYICPVSMLATCADYSIGYSGTYINLGMLWALRTISPLWRGMWNGVTSTRPADYTDTKTIKAIVLLTDGENESAFGFMSGMGMVNFDGTTYTAADMGISSTDASYVYNQTTERLNTETAQACTVARQKGILVYTVVYGLSSSDVATKNLMLGCAGNNTSRFFDTSNETELRRAFKSIARELASLRITR